MFFKKNKQKASKQPPNMPQMKTDHDGNVWFDFSSEAATDNTPVKPTKPAKTFQEPVLERLYVISRDNIQLSDAQKIVLNAAMNTKNGELLVSREVPLVWCAAYPDELFGEMSLPELLLGYVSQQEGEKYLNGESMVLPVEGKYNGYDYYLLALIQ